MSEDLATRVLCLPFWPGVEDHVSEILDSVSLFCEFLPFASRILFFRDAMVIFSLAGCSLSEDR